jgi:hypothetical protein
LVKVGNEEQLGELDDRWGLWGEYLPRLESFPHKKFRIEALSGRDDRIQAPEPELVGGRINTTVGPTGE